MWHTTHTNSNTNTNTHGKMWTENSHILLIFIEMLRTDTASQPASQPAMHGRILSQNAWVIQFEVKLLHHFNCSKNFSLRSIWKFGQEFWIYSVPFHSVPFVDLASIWSIKKWAWKSGSLWSLYCMMIITWKTLHRIRNYMQCKREMKIESVFHMNNSNNDSDSDNDIDTNKVYI